MVSMFQLLKEMVVESPPDEEEVTAVQEMTEEQDRGDDVESPPARSPRGLDILQFIDIIAKP